MRLRLRTQWSVSYTHLRAHETDSYLVCRLLLEKKTSEMEKNPKFSEVTKFTSEAISRQLVLHTRLPVSKNDS